MILRTALPLALLFFAACTGGAGGPAKARESDPETCFLLYNRLDGRFERETGQSFCKTRLPACSTFKVPLAVMAFDSGALQTADQTLKWDGKPGLIAEWNQDQNARTWMKYSVVWFSQRLTPAIGKERMQDYLRRFHYGNEDLSAGITTAWLVSPASPGPALRISAYEQIEFLRALFENRLGVSERAQNIAKDLIVLKESSAGRLSGKTGSGFYDREKNIRLGWFVGRIETRNASESKRDYLFAVVFRDLAPAPGAPFGGQTAKEIGLRLLEESGLRL